MDIMTGTALFLRKIFPCQGQKVIVTILDTVQRKEGIDIDRYIGRGKKMFQSDAQDYVRELRENDRL